MLRVEKLTRRAGRFRLNVDEWSIEEGQYVVMVGPSGAGKTMLLETIAGLNRPDRGRVFVGGADVTDAAPERRNVGFVYQDCWLFPHMTVRANIDFGRRYQRRAATDTALTTDALAEMLHIKPLLERRPRTLSGGERQRVALARALAIRPRLLFLDEPLGNLDPVTREHVAAELRNCHRQFGMTSVHVTHDHTEARLLGDATTVILQGRLQQHGPTEEVFGRPATVELARFLGCENIHNGEAVASGQAGRVNVRVGEHTLAAASDHTGPVMVCVPPEHVRVAPNGGDREQSTPHSGLGGRITSVSLRGALVRLVVDAGGENWVSLTSRSEQRQHALAVGDEVVLDVPPEAVHLICA